MFRKTRWKIVGLLMLALTLIFGASLAVIYAVSYNEVSGKTMDMAEEYARNYFAGNTIVPETDRQLPAEAAGREDRRISASAFCSVALDGSGNVIETDNDGDSLFSDQELTDMAKTLAAGGKTSGHWRNQLYLVQTENDVTLVVFLNYSLVDNSFLALFRTTALIGCGVLALLFLASYALAGRILRPLEENFERQKQFISDAGHELKTPVSVVGANAELLSREIGENRWLTAIRYENDRMASIVGLLLQLAGCERARAAAEEVDFSRLVTGGVLPFESVAFEKNAGLETDIEDGIFLSGDKVRLGQLISILTDNAVGHTKPDGTARVSLRYVRRAAKLDVSDTGAPIPPEEREKIFERFYRGGGENGGRSGHYGLGLAIAKAAAEAHRGKISVGCADGVTTFSVLLPGAYKK